MGNGHRTSDVGQAMAVLAFITYLSCCVGSGVWAGAYIG